MKTLRRALELDPNDFGPNFGLAELYAASGSFPEAIAAAKEAVTLSQRAGHEPGSLPDLDTSAGWVYATSGQPEEARRILAFSMQNRTHGFVDAALIARIHAALGDKDRAFEWLEKAYRDNSPNLALINSEHYFRSLRGDPRFADLLRRIGLLK